MKLNIIRGITSNEDSNSEFSDQNVATIQLKGKIMVLDEMSGMLVLLLKNF